MNKNEFLIFSKAMKTFFPKDNLLPTKEAMDLWFDMLQDIPYPVAEIALKKHVATSKWPPSIAEIRELSAGVTNPELPDWTEAWEKARKAVRKFGSYQEEQALEWLDPTTREAVKRFGYVDLCMMEEPEVAKAHFRDVYNIVATRKKTDAQLPFVIMEMVEDVQRQKGLLPG